MSGKIRPSHRDQYRCLIPMQTRWSDNDSYGHVNNVVYYSYFDTAVNHNLIRHGVLDIAHSAVIGLVIETKCTYFSSISFPDSVTAGLKVINLGNSSARYEIGLFRNEADEASALGEFVHVYVERATNRPVSIPDEVREVLQSLAF